MARGPGLPGFEERRRRAAALLADQTIQSVGILAQDERQLLLAPQLFGELRIDIRGGGQLTCRLRGLLLACRGDRTDQQSKPEGHLKHLHLFQD